MGIEKDFEKDFEKASTVEMHSAGMSEADIIEAMHKSCAFFIQFYLGDELEYAVPEFHINSWNLITNEMILYIALALPRGHAKTTLSKLCCVWYLLFTDTRFIVYLSNTLNVSVEACQDIIKYMMSDNHQKVFGMLDFKINREGHGYYKFLMNCPDGKGGMYQKFVILKALGAGQQVRGLNIDNTRPELAIVDDLEDNDNTASPILQKKLKLWFFGSFFKALSKKRHKIIYLGNMLSNQSILYNIVVKSDRWHSMKFGVLMSNGLPLWPEMWSIEQIQEDYKEYQKQGLLSLWFAEMMNMPMAEGQALIDPSEITYLPEVLPIQCKYCFITLDGAITQKTWGNDTALVVHGWVNERWQIVEVVANKFSLDQVFFLIIELGLKWHTRLVGIETGLYQIAVKFIFEVLMKAHNQSFEMFECPHKNKAKVERLAAWCGLLKQQMWVLTEGDQVITSQLVSFDPLRSNNVDDVIDACAMGPTMIELFMADIMTQYAQNNSDMYKVTHVVGD